MKVKITYTKVVEEEIDIAVEVDKDGEVTEDTMKRMADYLEKQVDPRFGEDIQVELLQLEIPDIGLFVQS